MARSNMIVTGPDFTAAVWMADFGSRDHLLPAPAHLDAADFTANSAGRKHVPSGTFLGRTRAEAAAGKGFGPWRAGDEEEYLSAFEVADAAVNPDVELYRHNSAVKFNFLPAIGDVPSGNKAAAEARIHVLYRTFTGHNGA